MIGRFSPLWPLMLPVLGMGGTLSAEDRPAAPLRKSVTVFPVVITGTPSENLRVSPSERVAEVVGLFLERAGVQDIKIGKATFLPPQSDNMAEIGAGFGEFVRGQPLSTEYAVFGQFIGTPETGPQEIRTIVVDKAGKVVFADRADRQAFSRAKVPPKCPMTCSLFLANRLGQVWDLDDPLRKEAPEATMAERMKKRSGLPPSEELAAIAERLAVCKQRIRTNKVTVYPVHLWPGSDTQCAARLAAMLNQQSICQAEVTQADPQLQIKGDPNEQKVLWDTARAFQRFLRKNPPVTDYALLADYGIGKASSGKTKVGHVHLILCDRSGNWVLIDYQNSHHDDFQQVDPRSHDDCNRLAARRLKSHLAN